MNQIKEFLKNFKLNTVAWLSIITIFELIFTRSMSDGAILFILYGLYKTTVNK